MALGDTDKEKNGKILEMAIDKTIGEGILL